jgi:DNA-binding CsgD family transcriptional regulator
MECLYDIGIPFSSDAAMTTEEPNGTRQETPLRRTAEAGAVRSVPGAEAPPIRSRAGANLWQVLPSDEKDPKRLVHNLGERIKELNCLYGVAQLAERHPHSIEGILAGAARILPPAWQYPETASARIRFRGRVYDSPGFRESRWRQAAALVVAGEPAGEVVVCYQDERPASFEGPFLREERTLINALADHLGTIAQRIEAEQKLQEINRLLTVEREALREANTALRTVLAKIDEEKREMGRDIHANVEKVLLPILQALALEVPAAKRAYVDLLRANLDEITAPFTKRLSAAFHALTPTEVAVCHMIRSGLRTKEIARLRGISPATVNRHREHVRRKLGLARRGLNLTTYLQSTAFSGDGGGSPADAKE